MQTIVEIKNDSYFFYNDFKSVSEIKELNLIFRTQKLQKIILMFWFA